MTDSETLYLVLVALYLLEGAAWVPRGSIALCARSSQWALPRLPHRTIGNARGGAALGFPFLSGATVFIAAQWPASLSPDGVLLWVAEALELEERAEQPGLYFSFDSIRKVSADGRTVWINDEQVIETVSPTIARRLADIIDQLRKMPRGRRSSAIESFVAEMFDVGKARDRIDQFYRQTDSLRSASFALWLVTLVLVPALAMHFGFERIWILAVICVYAVTWITAVLWVRAHRFFFPEQKWERRGYALLLALVPVSGMRATDLLARQALHGFHPAAAVAAMAPAQRARRFVGHLLRDAQHPILPICPVEDAEASGTEEFYRAALRRQMARMVNGLSWNAEEFLALPVASSDIDGEMACPRCHARYAAEAKSCEDCGGIELRAARISAAG